MISIVIATHKRASLLSFQLSKIMEQDYRDVEIIIVNDIEEPDETDNVVKEYPIKKYIKSSLIQGPSQKHIAGLEYAEGEYVYMPDDDDYLMDNSYFSKAIKKLDEDKELAFVAGNTVVSNEFEDETCNYLVKSPLNVTGRIGGYEYLQEFQAKYDKPYSAISTIFRKQAFDDMNYRLMKELSDSSMHMITLLWGDAYLFDDYVAVWRCKGGGITSSSSLSFVFNVLRQKEDIYYKAIGKLDRPKDFWFNQFYITYKFFLQNKKNSKYKYIVLLWGMLHCHLSKRIVSFVVRNILHI